MTIQKNLADNEESTQLTPEDLELIARFVAQCSTLKWGIQTEISNRLKASPRTISAIFTRTRLPGIRLLRTAALAGMDVEYVITGNDSKGNKVQVAELEREIDRLKTVLRSVVAIIEGEYPGTRSSVAREVPPVLTPEQAQVLTKYTHADAQIRAIIDGILERVPSDPPKREKPS
jgi:hypothetical protein